MALVTQQQEAWQLPNFPLLLLSRWKDRWEKKTHKLNLPWLVGGPQKVYVPCLVKSLCALPWGKFMCLVAATNPRATRVAASSGSQFPVQKVYVPGPPTNIAV